MVCQDVSRSLMIVRNNEYTIPLAKLFLASHRCLYKIWNQSSVIKSALTLMCHYFAIQSCNQMLSENE